MDEEGRAMLASFVETTRRSWSDESFRQRLIDSPRATLAELGWEIPEGTDVLVSFASPEEPYERPAPEAVVGSWKQQMNEGCLRLKFATAPPPGHAAEQLSDEDLDKIAAGGSFILPVPVYIPLG